MQLFGRPRLVFVSFSIFLLLVVSYRGDFDGAIGEDLKSRSDAKTTGRKTKSLRGVGVYLIGVFSRGNGCAAGKPPPARRPSDRACKSRLPPLKESGRTHPEGRCFSRPIPAWPAGRRIEWEAEGIEGVVKGVPGYLPEIPVPSHEAPKPGVFQLFCPPEGGNGVGLPAVAADGHGDHIFIMILD